jgi:hypothetical protein
MEKIQSESITSGDLYRLALFALNNVNNQLATSFLKSFPDVELLPTINLEPSILPITNRIPSVGDASVSTSDIELRILAVNSLIIQLGSLLPM